MSTLEQNIRRALSILLPKIQSLHQSRTASSHSINNGTTSNGTTAASPSKSPIFIGISGLQGSGKSTWAGELVRILTTEYHLHTITISLDDLYKTHAELIAQRDRDPANKLYRVRGQPGTHDEVLAAKFFEELRAFTGEAELRIPSFDKAQFSGEGDRAPESAWPVITRRPDVVVFEGWCVGFRPLPPSRVEETHRLACEGKLGINTPASHSLSHLSEVNDNLARYCTSFMGPEYFDFFIHIDTSDLHNVYAWRLQQEHKLIAARGEGMSDEAVRAFIDGYMPSYEMYLGGLREGFFEESGKMVRVVLDGGRGVERVETL